MAAMVAKPPKTPGPRRGAVRAKKKPAEAGLGQARGQVAGRPAAQACLRRREATARPVRARPTSAIEPGSGTLKVRSPLLVMVVRL